MTRPIISASGAIDPAQVFARPGGGVEDVAGRQKKAPPFCGGASYEPTNACCALIRPRFSPELPYDLWRESLGERKKKGPARLPEGAKPITGRRSPYRWRQRQSGHLPRLLSCCNADAVWPPMRSNAYDFDHA